MSWAQANLDMIRGLTWSHVMMSLPVIVLSVLLAVPLGWVAHRHPRARGVVLSSSAALYALPSLPLFVTLPVILGTQILDPINVIIALVIYGVALLVRTSAEAFDAISGDVRQAADAIGHSSWQRFWRVDLPLAGPAILAGVRVMSASTLSLVSVGALIGVPSLGYLFTDGFSRWFLAEIVVGLVGILALAALFDAVIVLAGRILLPWVRATDVRRRS